MIKQKTGRYLVILADRQKGHFFSIVNSSLERNGNQLLTDEVPQKVKAQGFRPGKIERHIRDHVKHHLKNVGQQALNFLNRNRLDRIDGVIIGGHKELLHQIKALLPHPLKNKVVREFIADLNPPTTSLAQKASQALRFG